tara:strand:- start:26 stop:2182 length:2157 start_codon:yes stop_codon:yes gene_type:complete
MADSSKSNPNQHTYMMLGRLQRDNDYFLGAGGGSERHLWAKNVDAQITEMKNLWNSLPKDGKPEWLSMEDIEDYEEKMKQTPKELKNGGSVKKFPIALQRRIDEINEMLPQVLDSDDIAGGYQGSTMYSYIELKKPIEIKNNFVYLNAKVGSNNYPFEKRYNVNNRDENSDNGRKSLMYDLGIINKAFKKLLAGGSTYAEGGGVHTMPDGTIMKDSDHYAEGGEIERLIKDGNLIFSKTKKEHSDIYGIDSNNPLFIQHLCIDTNKREKGLGKKVIDHIEDYAIRNNHDLIFGHISIKSKYGKKDICDAEKVKSWMIDKGYNIAPDTNDFYKKLSKGGEIIEINEDGSNLPKSLYELFGELDEDEDAYKEMERLRLKAHKIGYDFDYDLSGGATTFWKINKMAKGGSTYAEGGKVDSWEYKWGSWEAEISKHPRRNEYRWSVYDKDGNDTYDFNNDIDVELETPLEAENNMFRNIYDRIGYSPERKISTYAEGGNVEYNYFEVENNENGEISKTYERTNIASPNIPNAKKISKEEYEKNIYAEGGKLKKFFGKAKEVGGKAYEKGRKVAHYTKEAAKESMHNSSKRNTMGVLSVVKADRDVSNKEVDHIEKTEDLVQEHYQFEPTPFVPKKEKGVSTYAEGGSIQTWNLMVRKTPKSAWEQVNKKPMPLSEIEDLQSDYEKSGIKYHELEIHIYLGFEKGGAVDKKGWFTGELSFLNW